MLFFFFLLNFPPKMYMLNQFIPAFFTFNYNIFFFPEGARTLWEMQIRSMWCYAEKREQFGLSRAIFWDLPSNNSLIYSPRWLSMCVCTCICACVCFCVKCSVAHVSVTPFKNHVNTSFWSFSSAVTFNCPSANMKETNNFFSIQQFGTYTCDCLTSQHFLTKLCERREGGHMKPV